MSAPIYLFDCDETLEVGVVPGPVSIRDIALLKLEGGAIVGICGNWAYATHRLPTYWYELFSIIGPMGTDKPTMLNQIKQHIEASDYVLVGNDHASQTKAYSSPNDAAFAAECGWRFISEIEFYNGVR